MDKRNIEVGYTDDLPGPPGGAGLFDGAGEEFLRGGLIQGAVTGFGLRIPVPLGDSAGGAHLLLLQVGQRSRASAAVVASGTQVEGSAGVEGGLGAGRRRSGEDPGEAVLADHVHGGRGSPRLLAVAGDGGDGT